MSFNRYHYISILLLAVMSFASAQMAGQPGAFSRMGFGGRAMGMGNSFTAVRTGENSGFYNPAVTALMKNAYASASFGLLSLDRSLNSIFYAQPLDTNAGIAFGILNAGTSQIDGRDIDGYHTEMYSVSENLFTLSFALRVRQLSIGLTTKLYYFSLYEEVSNTTLGFDFGAAYPLTSRLTIAAVYRDFKSKYQWNTEPIYGQSGNNTIEKFPSRQILAAAYDTGLMDALLTGEVEKSSVGTTVLRFGGEITPIEELTFRAGIDGWDLKKSDAAHPSFGVTIRTPFSDWKPAFTYAYVLEPYGLFSMHVLSLSIKPAL